MFYIYKILGTWWYFLEFNICGKWLNNKHTQTLNRQLLGITHTHIYMKETQEQEYIYINNGNGNGNIIDMKNLLKKWRKNLQNREKIRISAQDSV